MKSALIFKHIKVFSIKKLFLLLVILIFGYSLFGQEITTITITNARQTTYTKDEKNGNDTIVLEGSVELSVSKGDTSSEIKADKITYDRKTEMLYAEGNVEILTKTSSSGGETTTASALLMNTATLEGAFDDGRIVQTQSDALNLPSGSTLIVFADIFGKSEDNTIAFKNSSLTFCDDIDPHWHINATRTWLLPGGEFAFFNAFLFVGVVPVIYLPAFYYPKDELIFNPVFSYHKREGYSTQNTIYLFGRKPLDTGSSSTSSSSTDSSSSADSIKALYNFMKSSSLKEQKLEGLVLHNLDKDYTGDTSKYFKIMADWYSRLGSMVGMAGNFSPAPNYISKLNFDAYTGFSNTIFDDYDEYLQFSPSNGEIYTDTSTFLGVTMPFRYGGNFEIGILKPIKLNISLPIYSDPFFAYDFKDNRSETMDWISYAMDYSKEDSKTPTISEVGSFTWSVSSSYSPTLPDLVKPYVGSFSGSMNSSVLFSSKNADSSTLIEHMNKKNPDKTYDYEWFSNSPNRKFYYPSQITPASISMSLSGTIYQYPSVKSTKTITSPKFAITLIKPEELKTPSEIQKEIEDAKKAEEEAQTLESSEEEANPDLELRNEIANEENLGDKIDKTDFIKPKMPELTFSAPLETIPTGVTYKLGYSITPNISTQVSYASNNLLISEDFDWTNIRSFMYSIKVPSSLTSTLNYGGNFLGMTNKLSYDPVFQKHPITSTDEENGGYTKSELDSLIKADYSAESQNVSNTNTVSFYPFAYTKHFAETGLSWNTAVKLYRKKFIGTADDPEWEEYALDFDSEDCVTVNSLNGVFGASEFNNKLKQSISLTSIMPPLLRQYTGQVNLTFPYVTTTVGTGYAEQTHDDVPVEDKWKFNPLQQSLTVSVLNNTIKFTESYNYDLEEKEHDSLKLTASWKSLYLSYVQSRTYDYTFDKDLGWQIDEEEKKFLPYSLSFSFAPSTKTFYRWYNRISVAPSLNTSIVADLIRSTNSYLLFSPSLTFKINEFFNMSFSSTSRNSVLYWYFHNEDGDLYNEWGGFPGNMLKDLFNSFRFDDQSLREGSGFKLKSLNLTMSHELHDWSFNMTYKVEPKLITKKNNEKIYDFTPYITIGIVWNPMESIKTNLVYEYDKDEEEGVWSLDK